eukprot:PLAT3398.2.p1 GENE.PLAT3398.2~~PLAT3398.2.p1  ORF type:complete len:440 (-),score=226.48 PLAT3398.2:152-1471(-)
MDEDAYSRPHDALATVSAKTIRNCTELYLGGVGFSKLRDFEDFVNLEVLWINDNRLSRIVGLSSQVRLRELYAHNNLIRSLDGSLRSLRFVDTLILHGNLLVDLHACLDILSRLSLKTLDLTGNPVTEELHYRLHVIRRLPSLEVLDRHSVTEEERLLAKQRRRWKAAKKMEMELPRMPTMEEPTGCHAMLLRDVARLKATEERKAADDKAETLRLVREERQARKAALTGCPLPTGIDFHSASRADDELSEWEAYELRRLFKAVDRDSSGTLSKEEVLDVLRGMEDSGRTVDEEDDEVIDQLFLLMDSDGSGAIEWDEFLSAMRNGITDGSGNVLRPRWRLLEPEENAERADMLFDKASKLQSRAMVMSDDDASRAELLAEAAAISQTAVRLERMAKEESRRRTEVARLDEESAHIDFAKTRMDIMPGMMGSEGSLAVE